MTASDGSLPLLLNPGSGSAADVVAALDDHPEILLQECEPEPMRRRLTEYAEAGLRRVIVSGGDGTIALAAGCLAGSDTELGVLPGGTLNHFTDRTGIPGDIGEALDLAIQGEARPVDVGYVDDRLFINTCAVGAYVRFVRTREYLEQRMNYHAASVLAGLRRLSRLQVMNIRLDGKPVKTPLVTVGVGERELRFPALGEATPEGRGGLHVIALRSGGALDSLVIAFDAAFRGVDPLAREGQLEHRLVEAFDIGFRRDGPRWIAVDGELVRMDTPLRFRYTADALRVVVPARYEPNPP